MDHISPSQIIQLVSGELPAAEAAALQSHLDECPACRAEVAEQRSLHNALGAWDAAPPAIDVSADVFARLDAESAARTRPIWRGAELRAAAAVLLGVGLGYGVGMWAQEAADADGGAGVAPAAAAPDYALFASPDVVGLSLVYDELAEQDAEDAS